MQYKVKQDEELLDSIVFNNYGSCFGYLEMVLEANSFLYRYGIWLPKGLQIELPEVKKEAQNRVSLWN